MRCFEKRSIMLLLTVILVISAPHLDARWAAKLDFSSRYIWRGFDLNPNNRFSLQPSLTYLFGDSGLAVNFWGSFSFADKRVNETDLTLSYDFKTNESFFLSVGFTHYGWYFSDSFQFMDHTSQEFYVTLGLPKVLFKPSFSAFIDVNNGSGLYLLMALSHSLPLADRLNLDLSAQLAFNSRQWVDASGFSHLTLGASVPFSIDSFTFAPFANIIFILLDQINPGVDHEFVFGLSVGF